MELLPEPNVIRPLEFLKPTPLSIKRPCDWGLERTVVNLETELGSIEAYNRLADAAIKLRGKIESGQIKEQNPCYRVSVKG